MTRFEVRPNVGTKFVGHVVVINEQGTVTYNVETGDGQGVSVEETQDGFHADVIP